MSGLALPGLSVSDLALPGLSASDLALPGLSASGLALPELSASGLDSVSPPLSILHRVSYFQHVPSVSRLSLM